MRETGRWLADLLAHCLPLQHTGLHADLHLTPQGSQLKHNRQAQCQQSGSLSLQLQGMNMQCATVETHKRLKSLLILLDQKKKKKIARRFSGRFLSKVTDAYSTYINNERSEENLSCSQLNRVLILHSGFFQISSLYHEHGFFSTVC